MDHQTSGVEQSISGSSNDSGCNSFGSETLLDQTEDRARAVLGVETTPDDARLLREADISVNDSGCHHSVVLPVDLETACVRGSNSESETVYVCDEDDPKEGVSEVRDVSLATSKIHAAKCIKPESSGLSDSSSPENVVQRRASCATKCQQNCAADGDSRGKVVTRKLRRTSMMVRPPPQQDKVTRTRRRHSFMLPNGSDVYPTRFSVGLAWPTIVEEDVQSTDAGFDEISTKQFPKHCANSEKDINSFANLRPFKSTLKSVQKLADVDYSEPNRASTSIESGFTVSDSNDHCVSADFLALGTKLRGSLQLGNAESGQTNSRPTLKERDVFEEGTFADLNAVGAELGRTTSGGGTPSPSPPTTRRPPSYGEALLHKALCRSDLNEAENLMTYQQALTAVCSPPDTTHLLTSLTSGDVTVTAEIGAEASAAGCRGPPPPYQLRPRRQNHGDDEIHHPWNSRSVQRSSTSEEITGRDAGQRSRTNTSEPAAVRVNKNDQKSPDFHRSNSFPSPRRRRPSASAQKENVCAVASPSLASASPRSASTVASSDSAGPSSRSPAESVDAVRKNSRNSILLKRRSLTMKDRDWHRELVDQYSGVTTSCSVSTSTTTHF